MDDLVVIDIPEERPAVEYGQGGTIEDDLLVLGVPSPTINQKNQDTKKEAIEEEGTDETLPAPEPRMCYPHSNSLVMYLFVYP